MCPSPRTHRAPCSNSRYVSAPVSRNGERCWGLLNSFKALENVAVLLSEERCANSDQGIAQHFSASNRWQPLVLQNRKDREFPLS